MAKENEKIEQNKNLEKEAKLQAKQEALAAKKQAEQAAKEKAEQEKLAKVQVVQAEKERAAQEKLAKEKAKQDAIAAKKQAEEAEKARVAKEKADKEQAKKAEIEAKKQAEIAQKQKLADEKLAKVQAKKDAELARENAAREKKEKAEQEKLAKVQAVQAEKERAAQEKLAKEKAKQDAIAAKKQAEEAEKARVAKEKADKEQAKKAEIEAKKQAEIAQKQKLVDEKAAKEKAKQDAKEAEKEKIEQEKAAKVQAKKDAELARENAAREKKEKAEQEKLAKVQAVQIAKDKAIAEKAAKEKAKQDAIAAKKQAEEAEKARVAKEKADKEQAKKAEIEAKKQAEIAQKQKLADEKAAKEKAKQDAVEAKKQAKASKDKTEKSKKEEPKKEKGQKSDKKQEEKEAKNAAKLAEKEKADLEKEAKRKEKEAKRQAKEEEAQQKKLAKELKKNKNDDDEEVLKKTAPKVVKAKKKKKAGKILLAIIIPLLLLILAGLLFLEFYYFKTVTLSIGENGNINLMVNDQEFYADEEFRVPLGADLKITISPDEGYAIKTITVNGENKEVTATGGEDQVVEIQDVKESFSFAVEFAQQKFTVVFKDHDGTVLKTETVDYAGSVTPPSDPTRTGFTFAGWNSTAFESIKADTTFQATYTINGYTVKFVDHDDTVLKTEIVPYLSPATAPSDPIRTGYTFVGWSKSYDTVTEDIVVKAVYTINKYTITFKDWNGSILKTDVLNHGDAIIAPIHPTKVGHTFAGWDVTFDKATADLTITATYTINRYTVTFVDWDGTELKKETVDHGTSATAPSDPTRTGHAFIGWDTEYSNVTQTLVVKACYTKESYTVIFKDWNGQVLKEEKVEYGGAATAPSNPTRTGYTFIGWNPPQYSNITGVTTITAVYEINQYTVVFKDYDGTTLKTEQVNYGSSATAPSNPTRTGYTFAGWNPPDYSNITGDTVITAQYIINQYIVTFKDWNGNILKTETVDYLGSATAPNDPTRTGYTFAGWDKEFDNVTADITVTATYTINSYTVVFKDWDGSVLKTETVDYLSSATAPSDPTRTGYTFTGWNPPVFDSITETTEIVAQYAINTYVVTFKDWNTTVLKTETVNYLGSATAPSDPTRTGYSFAGWDKEFGNITSDITVTATYTINSYTVVFKDWDGSVLKTETVNYLGSATAPSDPTRVGYTFTGWNPPVFNSITETTEIVAQYTINSYVVTFKDWNGDVLKTETVDYGSSATAPSDPTRTGYTFTGWDKEFNNVTTDKTVVATYTINSYTVTFKDWDGAVLKTETVNYLGSATAPSDPTRDGYRYAGWDKEFDSITGDLTITATYVQQFTVTFVDENDAVLKTEIVDYGSSATAPEAPTKTGYTFVGWDKPFSSITSAITIKTQYTINSYTVTFKDWDGNVLKTETVEYLGSATAPTDPTRAGYRFTGWDKLFDSITGDLTVEATYVQQFTVTFVDWDGTELKVEAVDINAGATAPTDPTRTGYTFTGWDKTFNNVTGDLTVTAQYTINSYTVTFVDHDDTVLKTDEVTYLDAATAPTDPTRAGYRFDGWDKAFDIITGDLTVKATYVQQFTVTFKDYDGTELKMQVVDINTGATAPADPTREGYTFAAWNKAFDNITGDLTVTATYTINTYFVTFLDHEGNELKVQEVAYLGAATAPEAPTRAGYRFAGWDKSFDSVTESITATATYVQQFTVTFVDWDDAVLQTGLVDINTAATAPSNPTRDGYTFTGWDKAFDIITGDLTVKATYTINNYIVTFKDWDGTTLKTEEVTHGSPATAPSDPTRTGYTFVGWHPPVFDSITNTTTITAQYTINSYTVTFKGWDGTVLKTETVEYLGSATAPEAPTRDGYRFAGWDKEFDSITGDLTVTATYVQQFTVTFKDYDGTVLQTGLVDINTAATAPSDPTRTGYTFASWDKSFENITADITVTATYTINTYVVTFVDHEGNELKVQEVAYLGTVTAPEAPTRVGYRFAGWDKSFDSVTESITVTATYVQQFTVTFVDWDGTVLKEQVVDINTGATAPEAPTRTGYTFTGWDKTFNNVASNLLVKAQYTIKTYIVTFVDHDGSELKVQEVAYLGAATAPTDPTRDGYRFTGWDTTFNSVTVDMTVKATYVQQFVVTFVDHDDTVIKSVAVDINTAAPAPENPTRTGHTFTGWDKTFNYITANLTVKATYTINTYTVTFKDWDGTELKKETVNYGSSASAPSVPTRTGYTFTGWDNEFKNITADVTVTAEYEVSKYTVIFKDWNTTVLKTETVEHGSSATAPNDPTRTGYTFAGWDKEFDNVTADITVTATYTINSYTVTFKDWDGTELKKETVNYGTSATAPSDPTRTGYTFAGWNPPDYSNITGDTVIIATYTINTYVVTFKDWDGNVLKTETVEHGSSATAPSDPTRTGYTFAGWDKEFNSITSDLTVTATYTINYYTVIFVDWDGTELKKQDVAYGSSAVAPDSAPERAGYTFTGWNPPDYSNITGDTTITAQYRLNTYMVIFKDWDGTVLKTEEVDHGASATSPEIPTRTGYTFAGWDLSFDPVTADLVITAKYTINTYVVTFKDWDGTVLKTETVDYGSSATAPADPTRTGYTFVGWEPPVFDSITSTTTITATYTINSYTVTFKDWDGRVLKTETVDYGTSATAPSDPTRAGYRFAGWDNTFNSVAGDLTVTATYVQQFTVTFVDHDGTELQTGLVDINTGATAPSDPARTGYTFVGWDKEFNNITGDLVVTATYTINTYTITFVDHDGRELKVEMVDYLGNATAPSDPTRAGYRFDGWDNAFDSITGDLTVTATYVQQFTITTQAGENGTITATQTLDINSSFTAYMTPSDGYYISSVTVDGVSIPVEVLNGAAWSYLFSDITQDHTISVTFAARNAYFDNTASGGIVYRSDASQTVSAVTLGATVNGRTYNAISGLPTSLVTINLSEDLSTTVALPFDTRKYAWYVDGNLVEGLKTGNKTYTYKALPTSTLSGTIQKYYLGLKDDQWINGEYETESWTGDVTFPTAPNNSANPFTSVSSNFEIHITQFGFEDKYGSRSEGGTSATIQVKFAGSSKGTVQVTLTKLADGYDDTRIRTATATINLTQHVQVVVTLEAGQYQSDPDGDTSTYKKGPRVTVNVQVNAIGR